MSGILARLFKYRPEPGRSPAENFFTEALAGVLEASDDLSEAFVQRIIDQRVQSPRVETQKSVQKVGQFDVWLEAQDESGQQHLIVIENKIGAPADPSQLARYADYLATQTHAASRTLLYVSLHSRSDFRNSVDQPSVEFRECRWFEIYDWLKDWIQNTDPESTRISVLAQELLDLMEEWNMDMNLSAADLVVLQSDNS